MQEKTFSRPSWDVYWMASAMLAAERASCTKIIKVGAVIVDNNNRISATGYNGSPPGEPHCDDVGCMVLEETGRSCQRVIHAEENAILQLAINSTKGTSGSTIYVTHFPCLNCMKKIVSVGIKRIVFWKKHKAEYYVERYKAAENLAKNSSANIMELPRHCTEDIMNLMYKKYEELSLDLTQ
ncbi:MAG: dCMP deaminase family protein [Candidatus Spechtbacterales bacterium]